MALDHSVTLVCFMLRGLTTVALFCVEIAALAVFKLIRRVLCAPILPLCLVIPNLGCVLRPKCAGCPRPREL